MPTSSAGWVHGPWYHTRQQLIGSLDLEKGENLTFMQSSWNASKRYANYTHTERVKCPASIVKKYKMCSQLSPSFNSEFTHFQN